MLMEAKAWIGVVAVAAIMMVSTAAVGSDQQDSPDMIDSTVSGVPDPTCEQQGAEASPPVVVKQQHTAQLVPPVAEPIVNSVGCSNQKEGWQTV